MGGVHRHTRAHTQAHTHTHIHLYLIYQTLNARRYIYGNSTITYSCTVFIVFVADDDTDDDATYTYASTIILL